MKNLLLIPLMLMTFAVAAQKSVNLQLGPGYSHIEKGDIALGDGIGYFFGVGVHDKITRVLGIDWGLNFLNQRTSVSDVTISTRSLNAAFAVNIFAGNSGLYFILGPEFGHTIGFKADGETVDADNDIRFSAVGGIGYQVNDRAAVFSRYHHAIDGQGSGYLYNVQVGFNFAFSTH